MANYRPIITKRILNNKIKNNYSLTQQNWAITFLMRKHVLVFEEIANGITKPLLMILQQFI